MSCRENALPGFVRQTYLTHFRRVVGSFLLSETRPLRLAGALALALSAGLISSAPVCARVATEFLHSVDQGVVRVSIPIEVPKGNANLTPVVSLEYASNNGQGSLGQGWIISGLGEVRICALTPFTDKVLQGANVDDPLKRNAFCLNGKRLIQVGQFGSVAGSRDPNAQEVQFRTEVETFQKIVAFVRPDSGDQGWGKIVGWRVWEKNGLITEYGFPDAPSFNTASLNNSRIDANSKAITWLKSRVLDTSGNTILYKYVGLGSETRRIGEIMYGANTKATNLFPEHHSIVSFDWIAEPVLSVAGGFQATAASRGYGLHSNAYVANSHYLGSLRTSTKAFNAANSSNPPSQVKHYQFDYHANTAYAAERGDTTRYLKKIQECEPGGLACSEISPVELFYGKWPSDF
jgi:Salmonella virulence plasmid 65kDa B protein